MTTTTMTFAELKKRLAAIEAATAAAPRAMQVQHSMIRNGEPDPVPNPGTDFHIINVLVRPSFKHDAMLPRPVETITIGPEPAEPAAEPAGVTRMPLIRRD